MEAAGGRAEAALDKSRYRHSYLHTSMLLRLSIGLVSRYHFKLKFSIIQAIHTISFRLVEPKSGV